MNLQNITLIPALLCTALISGLYYAYSCSVNPGLGRLPDAEYLSAMQSINRAIVNGLFFASFFGTLVFLGLTTFAHYNTQKFVWLLAAAVIYIIGSFGVTISGNVPLNDALDAFHISSASADEIRQMRMHFENPWNFYHRIRSIATFVSLIMVATACFLNNAHATEN
ncbi:anthrone oxygenase family protein [Flavobacterium pallidum]|uniref:DUF1772 domain-containing protein n=1 Tax=Flavobacterium pallidum TaxID=2172098 RepID=A0A2S1SFW4_9FLAO|nr:anthrone oxygenase family protein [Flavobacterium pallidum]AWI25308.1 DUF1772 domain-containing protein [Flavobacterium pallidum]